MPFHSATLLATVGVLAVAYWLVPWQRARLLLLLAASLTIYAWRHPPSVALLLLSIAFNYGWGRLLEARPHRALLAVGVAANLSSLVWFKYLGFLRGSTWMPLGISFFTFQVIAYLVDVYRKELPAERSLLVFAVFKSFFAQLVAAGPIVRGRDFLPQLRTKRVLDPGHLHSGVTLVLAGLFLKVGVADLLSQHVERAWVELAYDHLPTNAAWFAVYGYAAQLLADFCGYSTMAVGFGLLFGLQLPANFAHPYGADSLREFWRRWHVTLSSWLRDYLYIPLGGNRRHPGFNRLVTMTLGGLWHGAGLNFAVWGLLHGVWLALERRLGWLARAPRAVRVLVTFHVVALLWVPFRAPDLTAAWRFTQRLFGAPYEWRSSVPAQFLVLTFGFLLLQGAWFSAFPLGPRARPLTPRWELGLATAMVVWLLGYGAARLDFIYFVF